ncbi:hypothetical protein Agub_g13936 [Astrephomene gubernaculifera]|uniref:PAS domain-containing protein n=1 Tax=Astrephomene gubernaculifera TaxID=47775 RepID=A0AAD3E0N0_9CHLO|nr:hypothetical protein Agub_g13936 [Astrephomene gubernaculifera]
MSYAPSVGSSSSSRARKPSIGIKDGDEDGQGGNELDPVHRSSVENAVFGVLFTLSKENSETRIVYRWVLLKVLLDGWQLFTTIIQPMKQGWDINQNGRVWKVVNVLSFGWLSGLGYSAYVAMLYGMVGMLMANIALCVWVAWCFKEQRFPVIWPIKVLRLFTSVFFQALDVTSLNLLQVGISCRLSGPGHHLHLDLFPDRSCSEMPHVIHAIVSGLSLVVFILLALLTNMAEVEVNPTSRRPMALGHSGAEVFTFAVKALMTLVDVFIGWRRVSAVCYLLLALLLTWQYLRWSPNLVQWMNYLKTGVSAAITWCAAILTLLVFNPGMKEKDKPEWAHAMTLLMLVGLAPAFGVGALASWWYLRRMTAAARKALKEVVATNPLFKDIDMFESPRDVEIAARCCRVWVDRNVLDKDALAMAQNFIKAGRAQFPNDAFVALVQANFMIDALGVNQSGSRQVEAARKLGPGPMSRFIIFVRQQQATQKAAGNTVAGGQGSAMDLLGYVEYQRKQRMVVRLHREALQAMCNFWRALDTSRVSFTTLSRTLADIDSSVSQAQEAYRVVLETYGNSPRLVRLYGKFLETVKNDPWGAANYFAEADRLEQVKEDDGNGPLLPDGTPLSRMDDLATAVLVTASSGEIQMANKQAHVLFGYKKGDLDGKPLSALLAPHTNHRLTECLAGLVAERSKEVLSVGSVTATGPETAISQVSATADVLGMHRERMVFDLRISISRASGVGEDSTFIALLEPVPVAKNMARLWVAPNGVVAACDPNFVAYFGFSASDVLGAHLGSLMSCNGPMQKSADSPTVAGGKEEKGKSDPGLWDTEAVSEVGSDDMATVNMLDRLLAQSGFGGSSSPCLVTHRHIGPLPFHALAKPLGELPASPLYEIRLRPQSPEPLLVMVVDRKGAIKYATNQLASILSPKAQRHSISMHEGGGAEAQSAGHRAGGLLKGGAGRGILGPAAALMTSYTLQDFLPAPWKDMHTKLLQEPAAPASRGLNGRWTCRQAGDGPGPTLELRSAHGKPLYMRVSVSSGDNVAQEHHVVRLASSSLENALSERRLRLSLGSDGCVTAVSTSTPSQLFGFDVTQLMGRPIWELVEGLDSVLATVGDRRPGSSYSSRFGKEDAVAMMSSLLHGASAAAIGSSWRVTVTPPLLVTGATRLSSELLLAQRATRSRPALMQMHVHLAEFNGGGGLIVGPDVDPSSVALVDLWPTPAVTGVLELDAHGRIASVREEVTRPAGLLFGIPSETLLGEHLADMLALPQGKHVADLLSATGTKRSSLKKGRKDPGVKIGPVHVLSAVHADGRPLLLDVQVVARLGSGQPVTALLRMHSTPLHMAPQGAANGASARAAAAAAAAAAVVVPVSIRNQPAPVEQFQPNSGALPRTGSMKSPFAIAGNGPTAAGSGRFAGAMGSGKFGAAAAGKLSGVFKEVPALQEEVIEESPEEEPETPTPKRSIGDITSPDMRCSVRVSAPSTPSPPLPPNTPPPPPALDLELPLPGVVTNGATAAAERLASLVGSLAADVPGSERMLGMPSRQPTSCFDPSVEADIRELRMASAAGLSPREPQQQPMVRSASKLRPQGAKRRASPPPQAAGAGAVVQDDEDEDKVVPMGTEGSASSREGRSSDSENGMVVEVSPQSLRRVSEWVQTKGAVFQNTKAPVDRTGSTGEDMDEPSFSRSNGPSPANDRPAFASVGSGREVAAVAPQQVHIGRLEPNRGIELRTGDDGDSDGGQSAVSGQSGMSGISSASGAEFKRGKRFRKLVKMMDSGQAEQVLLRLRRGALMIMAVLAIVHIISFTLVVDSIKNQQNSMLQLYTAGRIHRYLMEMLINTRSLDQALKNKAPPTLYTINDTDTFADRVFNYATMVKELTNRVSEDNKNQELIKEEFYYTSLRVWAGVDATGKDVYGNYSLWDTVTLLYAASKDVYQNYKGWAAAGVNISSTQAGQTLLKSDNDVYVVYRTVLDTLLVIAKGNTNKVQYLQLGMLAAEGCMVSVMAAMSLTYLLRKLEVTRYRLYGIFLAIPVGLTRALCTHITNSLTLEEDEDDDDDEDAPARQDPNPQDDANRRRHATLGPEPMPTKESGDNPHSLDADPSRKLASSASMKNAELLGGADRQDSGRRGGWLTSCLSCLPGLSPTSATNRGRYRRSSILPWLGAEQHTVMRSGNSTSNAAIKSAPVVKRHLTRDARDTAKMLLPFVVWSLMVVIIYAVSVSNLQNATPLVAIAEVANFNNARTLRTCFYSQELASEEDPSKLKARRALVKSTALKLRDAFYTLELGDDAYKALGENTEKFPLVTAGLAYETHEMTALFYSNTGCLRIESPCPGPEYRYYQISRSGVDSVMQVYLKHLFAFSEDNSTEPPGLNNTHFDFIYNVGMHDLTDAIIEIGLKQFDYISVLFGRVVLLHIILFIFLFFCLLGFTVLLLNPFIKRIKKEKRRIAELLSQLPMELDVEKLVQRALGEAEAALSNPGGGMVTATEASAPSNTMKDNQGFSDAAKVWKTILKQASSSALSARPSQSGRN